MRTVTHPHLHTMRDVLAKARAENARMAAATIGGHLARISRDGAAGPEVEQAREAVRDASFDLLRSFHRDTDSGEARRAALAAMDRLETSLGTIADDSGKLSAGRLGPAMRLRWPWAREQK